MNLKPSTEQLKTLKPVERLHFRIAHSLHTSPVMRKCLTAVGSTFSKWWVECGTSKTVSDHGFENFKKIDPSRAVLLVVNHRSFYDQFVIAARLFSLYGRHHHVHFPVRSNFFYDNPLGLFVNLPLALGVMYPPIVRDRKRRSWNEFATELMVELLKDPQNLVGFHPEGTRNKGPDPYALLPAKPGCGELIHRTNPNVVPVFLQGFPKNPWLLLRSNLRNSGPEEPFVHMVMGEPLDLSKEIQWAPSRKTYLLISQKVRTSIAELGEREREIRAQFGS